MWGARHRAQACPFKKQCASFLRACINRELRNWEGYIMQTIANNYFLSIACSTAAWFVVKASCRFVFGRLSSAYRSGLPQGSAAAKQAPAVQADQQLEAQQQQIAAIKRSQRRFLTYVVGPYPCPCPLPAARSPQLEPTLFDFAARCRSFERFLLQVSTFNALISGVGGLVFMKVKTFPFFKKFNPS